MFSFRKKENVQFSQKVGVFKEKPRLQYLLPWAFIELYMETTIRYYLSINFVVQIWIVQRQRSFYNIMLR